jgi:copper resistance protein B
VGPDATADRTSLAIGVLGLAPYRFEIAPTIYLTQDGDTLAKFSGSTDLLFTQRLILQPRLDANVAFSEVKRSSFRVGKGLNDVELGVRLRYEIRRELAPYVGVSWKRSYGGTADLQRRAGEDTRETRVLVGLRMWF